MGAKIRGVLFDLDGTLYEGDSVIPGAREAVNFCEVRGVPFRFVTNTTSKPRAQICRRLHEFGINSTEEQIFTAPAAARSILIERGWRKCYFLLREALRADFEGIQSVEEAPQAVVVGDLGDEFSYEKLNKAFRFLVEDKECAFVTLARNRCYRASGGLCLDVGAFVAALEYGTGNRSAELVGKPASAFFEVAVASMGVPKEEVFMFGDDLESDVLGAQSAGLRGVLVRTGKSRGVPTDENSASSFIILESIAELPGLAND